MAFFFFAITTLSGQTANSDTIFKFNGDVILCKVREIGPAEIKFIQPEINPDVTISINKKEVKRIVYFNGQEQLFEREMTESETIEKNSEDLFALQKKNAVKIDFLSLATNVLSFTYERCLKPGQSLEFTGGIVGVGFAEKDEEASGILFRGGYKLMKNPDYYLQGMRYAHILKGRYIKFEFDFASYGVTGSKEFFSSTTEKYTINKWALMMVFGNQWVFNDNLLVDLYSGIGLGKNNLDNLDSTYPYGFLTFGEGFPMAYSFGVRIGFLIK